MKIDDRKGVLDPQLAGTNGVRPEGGTAPAPRPAASGDRVSVSDTARELAALRAAIGDLDGVRTDRVAALQAAIDGGRYVVDAHAVARTLLGELIG